MDHEVLAGERGEARRRERVDRGRARHACRQAGREQDEGKRSQGPRTPHAEANRPAKGLALVELGVNQGNPDRAGRDQERDS